ncbi:hypothetical protein RB213_011933 [Colletotrichum asianum]
MFYDVYQGADRRQVQKDAAKSIKKVMNDRTCCAGSRRFSPGHIANTWFIPRLDPSVTLRVHCLSSKRIPKIATVPDFVWIWGASDGSPDLQVVLDINNPTVRGLISKAVHPGLLNFHREIDSANGDKYAEMNTLCDDPDDHPIRGWYKGSEKVKARILDLKEDTQDQVNDALDAEEDGYHERGQEAEARWKEGSKIQGLKFGLQQEKLCVCSGQGGACPWMVRSTPRPCQWQTKIHHC